MTSYLIQGAQLLGEQTADILVEDGVIRRIGPDLAADAGDARILDAAGLVALPGLVDIHTHLREPGREDAETVALTLTRFTLGSVTAQQTRESMDLPTATMDAEFEAGVRAILA